MTGVKSDLSNNVGCINTFLSARSQPYSQREAPIVRVVEGPLFSEVVAHYQHFQQTVRIHNVPGTPSILQASICSAHKFDCVRTSCPVWSFIPDISLFVSVVQELMVFLWTSPPWWTSEIKITRSWPCGWLPTSRAKTLSTQTSTASRWSPHVYKLLICQVLQTDVAHHTSRVVLLSL